jgi:peptidyl-prolyl cis-trans isomerase C
LQEGDLASEIETALLGLDADQVGDAPVRTRHGWHVVRLDRSIAPSRIPFEAVAPMIGARLRERAWAASAARYVEALASAANIDGIALKLGGAG